MSRFRLQHLLILYLDRIRVCFYTSLMRLVTLTLLVVLMFTALGPLTVFTFTAVDDGSCFFGNLDVCHTAAPALSSNGEMPCVGLAPCSAAPTLSISFIEPAHPVYAELILTSRTEHPPRS